MCRVKFPSSLLFVIAVSLVMCSCPCLSAAEPNAAAKPPDAFAVNKLIGRGVSLGNALEAPNEGDWGVTLQEEYFQLIKDAGFNSIRLPVRWSIHAANEPPYTIDPNFLNRVDWAIKNTLSRNMVFVFNMHNYYELSSDPNGQKEKFIALWKQLAEHYKDYPNTLLFEFLNEPSGKLGVGEWNSLLNEVLAVVRQSNPNRMVVIAPASSFSDIFNLKSLDLPKDDRNIIVTFHYYLPFKFTHQGASWENGSDKWLGMKWTGSEQEKRLIAKDFNVVTKWANQNNRPIYLGEFGTIYKADPNSRVQWTKCVADTAAECGFSMSYWEFCHINFGLYDTETKSWHKELLEAVIPPKQ
ncbi:MAG: glycoside hydrolase family 5 protein [Sedimentisphaerales bacterium]|nr:glycoside hydrolase family 5 protein [Sedimentisphaerales bacterium]